MTETTTDPPTITSGRMRTPPFRLILLLGLLLMLVWLGLKAVVIGRHALSLYNAQNEAQALAGGGIAGLEQQAVVDLVSDAHRDLSIIHRETEIFMPILRRMGWVPQYGSLLKNSDHLLEMADAGSHAAAHLTFGMQQAIPLLQDENAGDSRLSGLVQIIDNGGAFIATAKDDMAVVEAAFSEIPAADIETMPPRISELLTAATPLLELGESGLQLAEILPELAGMDEPRTYLVLAQNADELRPTGGFISGFALLRVDRGSILSLDFQDAYTIDNFQKAYAFPPEQVNRFMGIELYTFRDSNFWPDFPISAEQAITLYQYQTDSTEQIDGVLALDQFFVELLVAAVGPIRVPELETVVNGNNVIRQMQAAWGTGEEEDDTVDREWFQNRKSFMGSMVQAVQSKIINEPTSFDASVLVQNVLLALERKHLMLYVNDQEAADVLRSLGWDGAIDVPSKHDYLLPLDTNMGYNKANFVIDRSLTYQVTLDDAGNGTAALDMTYMHGGESFDPLCYQVVLYRGQLQYRDLLDVCYYNYLRVYTPSGTELLNGSEHPAPAEWFVTEQAWIGSPTVQSDPSGLTVIDNFIVVPRGQTVTTSYRYSLPPNIVSDLEDGTKRYQLTLAKQAGAKPQSAVVIINLPPGTTQVKSTPNPTGIAGNQLTFEVTLDRDVHFEVAYR